MLKSAPYETPNTPDLHSLKMFVGQIPHHMTEPELLEIFTPFGPVFELIILRKRDGTSRGCCFVQFFHLEDAAAAEKALDGVRILPPKKYALTVKIADHSKDRNARKLFVGQLGHTLNEEDLKTLFGEFGELEETKVLRNPDGSSKGCAFVTYVDSKSAAWAIKKMENNRIQMENCSEVINVKYAETSEFKANKRRASLGMTCGETVDYDRGQKYFAPRMRRSLDDGQKGCQERHLERGPVFRPISRCNSTDHIHGMLDMFTTHNQKQQIGPYGANIFVYHLPSHYKDDDLLQLFKDFGNIVSVKVFIDKQTHKSKRFGFVSFDAPASATKAIENMNGFELKITDQFTTTSRRLKVELKNNQGSQSNLNRSQSNLNGSQSNLNGSQSNLNGSQFNWRESQSNWRESQNNLRGCQNNWHKRQSNCNFDKYN